jgi:predicted Rossmann fold nucleotide-binding protein DprA/Smf involved in DNA uptake
MKIAITIELDEKSAELFQLPFKKLSKQINDLIGMFEKVDYTVEAAPDIEPKPVLSTKSAPKKPKKKAKSQRSMKAIILKTIKKNKDGIKIKDLQEQTGFTGKQISNNMFYLKKEKKVEKTKEGLFIAL